MHEEDSCRVDINNLPSGFRLHSHDYVEIVIILGGSGEHNINGKTYPVASGDVYVLQGMQEHGFQNCSSDFRILNVMYRPDIVCFPLDRLKTLPGYQALFLLEPARRRDGEFHSLLRLDSGHLKELLEKVNCIRQEMEMRLDGFDTACQAYLIEMIVLLSRFYSCTQGASTAGILRFSEAVAWMEENFLKSSTISQLARRSAMSERHFLRTFKKTFDVSPLEYLINLRIRYAAGLLHAGRHNITETAEKSGFRDSNYFSRQFKRIMGVSPRQYTL